MGKLKKLKQLTEQVVKAAAKAVVAEEVSQVPAGEVNSLSQPQVVFLTNPLEGEKL